MMEPALLYCPNAYESDMVHAVLKEDDMGSMKTLY